MIWKKNLLFSGLFVSATKPKIDLLVSEDHTLNAGTKQNHTGHVLAVVDQESKGIS